jgi:hypothetical protein
MRMTSCDSDGYHLLVSLTRLSTPGKTWDLARFSGFFFLYPSGLMDL